MDGAGEEGNVCETLQRMRLIPEVVGMELPYDVLGAGDRGGGSSEAVERSQGGGGQVGWEIARENVGDTSDDVGVLNVVGRVHSSGRL